MITTHVLDTARGKPAQGVPITLSRQREGGFDELGRGVTDADGRLRTLLPAGHELSPGIYALVFDTAAYFKSLAVEGFYPVAVIHFEVREKGGHYHVPLLLSPFGYSTYRGS